MFAKKAASPQEYKRKLEILYHRRFTIVTLMQSLENYDRYREKAPRDRKRKTA